MTNQEKKAKIKNYAKKINKLILSLKKGGKETIIVNIAHGSITIAESFRE